MPGLMLESGLQTVNSKPVLYFVYQMEQFHQRNLASSPRTKDESFALKHVQVSALLIRGWCWHGTCTSGMWITAPTQGGARKAPATRSLRLFPSFSIDYSLIQQTFEFVSFFNSSLPMEFITGHISKPTTSVVFLPLPSLWLVWISCPWLSFLSPGSLLPLSCAVAPDSGGSRTHLLWETA